VSIFIVSNSRQYIVVMVAPSCNGRSLIKSINDEVTFKGKALECFFDGAEKIYAALLSSDRFTMDVDLRFSLEHEICA